MVFTAFLFLNVAEKPKTVGFLFSFIEDQVFLAA